MPGQPQRSTSSLGRVARTVLRGAGILLATIGVVSCVTSDGSGSRPEAGTAAQTSESQALYAPVESCLMCHQDQHESLAFSKHGATGDLRAPLASDGCQSCHGPGLAHIQQQGNPVAPGLVSFGSYSPSAIDMQNEHCIQCHRDQELLHWKGSTHQGQDLRCVDCHSIHSKDAALDAVTQSEVCYECHRQVQAESFLFYAHPIRFDKMACTSCHNPHGSITPAMLKGLSVTETCYSCHANLRGPYLWEHPPASEDCSHCHLPHGSSNPSMLIRRPPQLCQSCHQVIQGVSAGQHINRVCEFEPCRAVLGYGCVNCHSKVHGSNHPSGVALTR